MKEIQLTQGQVAKVSDDWYEELNKFKWYAVYNAGTKSFYAARTTYNGKKKKISMHRIIANTPDGMECDHIDHDTLNNLLENLRNCTKAQNQHNSKKRIDTTSGYKSVSASGKKWRVRIQFDGKRLHLGSYPTPKEAAQAYDEAAKELHGEFANLNFPK